MYCYSNDGLSMRAVAKDYTARQDEVLFEDHATPSQLASAFPNYQSAAGKESIKAQIAELEVSVTERMKREALAADDEVNPHTGKTASQQISAINAKIKSLRAQLASLT